VRRTRSARVGRGGSAAGGRRRGPRELEKSEGKDDISRAGSSMEGGGGVPRRTKWRKCWMPNLRVAKLKEPTQRSLLKKRPM
jgi:hypothetical protein